MEKVKAAVGEVRGRTWRDFRGEGPADIDAFSVSSTRTSVSTSASTSASTSTSVSTSSRGQKHRANYRTTLMTTAVSHQTTF